MNSSIASTIPIAGFIFLHEHFQILIISCFVCCHIIRIKSVGKNPYAIIAQRPTKALTSDIHTSLAHVVDFYFYTHERRLLPSLKLAYLLLKFGRF